jgi:hypothetical protein
MFVSFSCAEFIAASLLEAFPAIRCNLLFYFRCAAINKKDFRFYPG